MTGDDVVLDPEPFAVSSAEAADVDTAVAAVTAELIEQGRTVEVLVAIGGVDPTAVLALDVDTDRAAVVTLDYDATDGGVALVDASIAAMDG